MDKNIRNIVVWGVGLFFTYRFLKDIMPHLKNTADELAYQNALQAKNAASEIFRRNANIIDVVPPI